MLAAKKITSRAEAVQLLNCRRLPARLNTTETSVLLGVQEHDIPALIAARLLLPLGKPAPNAPKYFAAVEIVERAADPGWLAEATKALAKHWQRKNQRKFDHALAHCN
jgi:hypothetical protein